MINFKELATIVIMTFSILYTGNAQAKCKQGSHVSHSWIKAHYQNCTNCGQKKEKGKVIYYCDCDCPQSSNTSNKKNTTSTVSKKSCSTKQYLLNDKCTACPSNATCDGKTFACKNGYTKSGNSCVKTNKKCAKNQWLNGTTCTTCPSNATCDGKTFKCGSTFTKTKNNSCACASNLLYVPHSSGGIGKCATCPANATCNGTRTFTCKSGYTKSGNSCTKKASSSSGSSGKKCEEQGSHDSIAYIKKNYKNCSNCRTENVAAGKCSKNKKAHKHYYCMCGEQCTDQQSSNKTTSKQSGQTFQTSSTKKCKKGELALPGGMCTDCPRFTICDGSETIKCPTGYKKVSMGFTMWEKQTGNYFSGNIMECAISKCPTNGECGGVATNIGLFRCKDGYYKITEATCAKCPENADCEGGETFTCKDGFKQKNNGCVAQ